MSGEHEFVIGGTTAATEIIEKWKSSLTPNKLEEIEDKIERVAYDLSENTPSDLPSSPRDNYMQAQLYVCYPFIKDKLNIGTHRT